MSTAPPTVRIARILITVVGLLWLSFGLVTGVGVHPSYRDSTWLRWGMAAAAVVSAGLLLLLARRLGRPDRLSYWLSVMLLAGLTLAVLMDQLGVVDLLVLLLTISPLGLLLRDRRWFLARTQDGEKDRRAV